MNSRPRASRFQNPPYIRPYHGYLFVLPGLIIYAIFVLWPIINTARYSLFDWTGFSEPVFVGLDNYVELWRDEDFWLALQHNAFFVIFYSLIPIALGLFLTALMTQRKLHGMSLFRTGLFIPQVMSAVVIGIIWRWLLAYDGPINELLIALGFEDAVRPWLGDFTWARYAVGGVGTWVQYGLTMVLFIAGAQSIGEELYDAAKVAGANAWQEFRYVTLPGLRGQILVAFVLTFIAALRVFDLVFVLTRQGGPGKETTVVSLLIYQEAFQYNRAGYGAAMAMVLSVIIVAVSALVMRLQDDDAGEGA